MREPWLVLVPTWARADGLRGTPDMSPALNYKALLYATPTHLPSICPFTRPHVIISALSMHLPPVLWAWIRAPATHFLGARILTTLPLSIPPAAFSALPQHLPSPFSVIILSSQYLFQRGPIWIRLLTELSKAGDTLTIRHLLVQRCCPSSNGYLIPEVLIKKKSFEVKHCKIETVDLSRSAQAPKLKQTYSWNTKTSGIR